jgi:hypothetical protein
VTCPAGDACENGILLKEYEKVEHLLTRRLARECAELRIQVNRLEAELVELRDPEEVRDDGERVRKDRWESAVRNIAHAMGWPGPGEASKVVDAVKKLVVNARDPE